MKFFSQYQNRPKIKDITFPPIGERLVDTLGYIPMAKRLEQLMTSGRLLASARREQYDADYRDDYTTIPYAPLRDRGLDFMDSYMRLKDLSKYLYERDIQRKEDLIKLRNAKSEAEKKAIGETIDEKIRETFTDKYKPMEKEQGEGKN